MLRIFELLETLSYGEYIIPVTTGKHAVHRPRVCEKRLAHDARLSWKFQPVFTPSNRKSSIFYRH